MFGFRAFTQIASTSIRKSQSFVPQMAYQYTTQNSFMEIQTMINKSISVPNSVNIMNLR